MERQPPPLLLSVEFFPALIHRFTAEPSPSWGACGWDLRGSPGEIAHENATSYLTYLMEGPPGLSSIEAALDALDQQPAPLMALVPRGSALRIFGGKQRFARELWRHYGQPVARVVGAYGAAWERREHGMHASGNRAGRTKAKGRVVRPQEAQASTPASSAPSGCLTTTSGTARASNGALSRSAVNLAWHSFV